MLCLLLQKKKKKKKKEKTCKKPEILPLTKDIEKLRKFLLYELNKMLKFCKESTKEKGNNARNNPQNWPQKSGTDNIHKKKETHVYCVTTCGYECSRIRMGTRTFRTYCRCSSDLVQAGSVNT